MLLPPIANEGPCRELSGRNPFAVSTMTRLGVLTGKCASFRSNEPNEGDAVMAIATNDVSIPNITKIYIMYTVHTDAL